MHQVIVDGLVLLDGGIEGHIHDLIVADTDHHVALAVEQGLDAGSTHATGDDAVVGCGATTALQVSEDGDTHVELRELIAYALGIVHGTTQLGVLGYEHDTTVLGLAHTVLNECSQLVLMSEMLGDDSRLGVAAIDALKDGQRNIMVGVKNDQIVYVPFNKAIRIDKPIDRELINVLNVLSI